VKIIDFPQGSAEWAAARAGRVTASRIVDVLSRARDRKSEGATRANYKAQVIAEILTGRPQEDGYTNEWMDDGIENEPFARAAYDVRMGGFVDQVGFVVHPRMERSGASPDGLVGTDGMAQFKCPRPATHIAYTLGKVVPSKYEPQLVWEMECCERKWSDFVSYCPAFPAPLDLFIVRLQRDAKRAIEITAEVTQFNREVDEIIERLTSRPVDEFLERLHMKAACL
jgi:hypothetical protein